jgi:hypothetical protein
LAEEIEGAFHHTPLYPSCIGEVYKQEKPQIIVSTKLSVEAIIHPAFPAKILEGKASMETILGPKNGMEK